MLWEKQSKAASSRCTPKYPRYIRNFAPDRWPAGDPRGVAGDTFGFHDIDASPTKTLLAEQRTAPEIARFFELAMNKRPAEELFDLRRDPGTIENVADQAEYAEAKRRLWTELEQYLKQTGDLRALGGGEVWETYTRYSPIRKFE